MLAVMLAAGCGASSDIDDVEDVLAERYLDPLAEAGITVSIEEACRYPGSIDDAPWHLYIELRLDASQRDVADVLAAEGMVVRGDHEPMTVQQIPGDIDGWNGALRAAGSSSVLGLTYNNATRSGWSGAVGWAEECPDTAFEDD